MRDLKEILEEVVEALTERIAERTADVVIARLEQKHIAGPGSRQDDELMTIEESAEWLGLSKATLYKWSSQGTVPVVRIGRSIRFRRSDLSNLSREGTRSPETIAKLALATREPIGEKRQRRGSG